MATPLIPASLYVGDLHPDVKDGQLFDHFSQYKSLASVRVCRDSSTGRSLCYGYVNFISPQDAKSAIEEKNYSVLNGKVIRVTWSHRDPDARSGIGNVFVKNLSDSIDNSKLHELFQKFGTILSCKVVVSDDGKSKGHGFVQFDSEESANESIEKLNGFTVEGKQMYVAKFVKKSDRGLPSPDTKYTNLYFKNLDPDISEDALREKFSAFGKILSLVVSKDDSGSSRGFGFVNFDTPDDARKALETMDGLQLGSKVLYVARAQKKEERQQLLRHQFEEKRREQIQKNQASNVYVKNIDDSVSDEELREHFTQCGTITSLKLMRDDKGISRGFGFVCFSTPEEANKAVHTLHGNMFHGKPLYVTIAQRKEERIAQLQLQIAQHMAGLPGSTAVYPGGYPSVYYVAPPGVVPQVPPQPGMMYPPIGLRPGWRGNGFLPALRPGFQPSPLQPLSNSTRPHRQNRGRINGHVVPSGGSQSVSLSNDSNNHQRTGHTRNGRLREMNRRPVVPSSSQLDLFSAGFPSEGSDMLSWLAAAPLRQQKEIIGARLYPLVREHMPELAGKITGMLLDMDNSELLLLLESPESLAAKVEEALQVLKLSKAKVSTQDSVHQNYLSAEVAVS